MTNVPSFRELPRFLLAILFVLHLVLTVIISVLLYYKGEAAAEGLRSFARRLASGFSSARSCWRSLIPSSRRG